MHARRLRILGSVLVIIVLLATGWLLLTTRSEAQNLLTQGVDGREWPRITPTAFGLPYEEVLVVSSGETELVGWYVPTQNGAVVMAQHGFKNHRAEMLNQAAVLAEHGYGVLLTSVRAHDRSGGTEIAFGDPAMDDLDTWYRYLLTRPEVDPERIGMLGNSYGGMLAIQYAAQNPAIKAVVTQSAFSSLEDTISTSVTFYTGLPPFPFAPLIAFWAEQQSDIEVEDIDATEWIGQISPRPVFLMQGGADTVISPQSGQRLYDAAGEPKELWFEPELGHTGFDYSRPNEYEARVITFFDRYLGR